MDIKTFIFLDCETTGLPVEENYTTKITELCLTAVRTEHILLGKVPRIQNKLSLCFDPKKNIHPIAAKLSQLTNNLLDRQAAFDTKTLNMIQDFISVQCQPVCFVAHNGDKFDYPILRTEFNNAGNGLPQDILCVDSYCAFRDLYFEDTGKVTGKGKKASARSIGGRSKKAALATENIVNISYKRPGDENIDLNSSGSLKKLKLSSEELTELVDAIKDYNKDDIESTVKQFHFKFMKVPSFKLSRLYKMLTSKKPIDAHQAEYDVSMLIACAAVLNRRFVNWANSHAKKFHAIKMMGP